MKQKVTVTLIQKLGGWKHSPFGEPQSNEKNQQICYTHRLLQEKIRIHKKLQEYIKKAHFPLATKKDFYRDVWCQMYFCAWCISSVLAGAPRKIKCMFVGIQHSLWDTFLSLSLGLSSAPEVFRWKIQHIFVGVSRRVPKSTELMLTSGENPGGSDGIIDICPALY